MDNVDHAQEAAKYLGYAKNTSGDYLNASQEGTINALAGIGHALLALNETLASADYGSGLGGVRDDLAGIAHALRKGGAA